ncbi:MAG: CDP-alcohol phosphatidyltransferase family protein [Longimicrobiales bacterium]
MPGGAIPSGRASWRTLPIGLTLLRIALAPAFAVAPSDAWRGVVLVAATASEFLDGWLARRMGRTSRIGELLDPVADRIFVATALLTFVVLDRLSPGGLLVLLVRDLYTAAAAALIFLLRLPLRLKARMPGKIVTGLQLFALVVLLLRPMLIEPLLVVIGVAAVVAIVDYTLVARRRLRRPVAETGRSGGPGEADGV